MKELFDMSNQDPLAKIDEALADMTRAAGGKTKSKRKKQRSFSFRLLLLRIVVTLALLICPFIILVRGSVYLHLQTGLNHWIALSVAVVGATVFLLLVVFLVLRKRAVSAFKSVSRISLFLVLTYCIYTLVYVSGANVKTEAIRSTYRSLHPLLRVGVSTLVTFNKSLVITDVAREPDDYRAMGLSKPSQSFHYPQEDGYVHAIDLRTIGRPEWKNFMVTSYFRLMGFKTLRHIGTADHLHVYLPLRE